VIAAATKEPCLVNKMLTLSVIVPVHNHVELLERCLDALLRSSVKPVEIIVVDDGSTDPVGEAAASRGVSVLRTGQRRGPAHARNLGAGRAFGDLLVFIDSDVLVHADTLSNIRNGFADNPALQALFGSYDAAPAHGSLVSQYRNLLHHYVHQQARRRATTFWAGCGAIRRETYLRLGGMNEAFDRPSIEDIEFGYRLCQAGLPCELHKNIHVTHLKQWTLANMLRSDLLNRAIPWTMLMLRTRVIPTDLNLTYRHRAATLLSLAIATMLILGMHVTDMLPVAGFMMLIWLALNGPMLRWLRTQGGFPLMAAGIPLHFLYNLTSAVGFILGAAHHLLSGVLRRRWLFRSCLQNAQGHPAR
jgi:GT2 family glycosyltransferase